jgi:hypothetical protein
VLRRAKTETLYNRGESSEATLNGVANKTQILRNKVDSNADNISGTILISRDRLNILISLLLTLTIIALLVLPIYVLSHLTQQATAETDLNTITILVLLLFTVLFSGALLLFTTAKRHEILSAAAA